MKAGQARAVAPLVVGTALSAALRQANSKALRSQKVDRPESKNISPNRHISPFRQNGKNVW